MSGWCRRRCDRTVQEIPEDQDRPPGQVICHRGCADGTKHQPARTRFKFTLTRLPPLIVIYTRASFRRLLIMRTTVLGVKRV